MSKSLQWRFAAPATWIAIGSLFAVAALGALFKFHNAFPGATSQTSDIFVDATEASGLNFVHTNGMKGQYYFAEIIGSGVAVFDYDNDGRADILVLNGTALGEAKSSAAESSCSARLFHNEMPVGDSAASAVTFKDVTEKSGLCLSGYGMGVAIGDYDNDGFLDVFITQFGGSNRLLRNQGDGTFKDVS